MTKRTPTPTEVQAERAQATQDYNEEMQAVRDRTAKLRAERLAREADPQFVPVAPAAAAKKPAKAKTMSSAKSSSKSPAKTSSKSATKSATRSRTKSASKAQKQSLEASPEAES